MPHSIFQLLTHSLTTLSLVACDLFRLLVLVSRSRCALIIVILDRMFSWPGTLVNVKPDTFIHWHIAAENPTWGEERIANELDLKLTIRVSPRTVGKYLGRDCPVRTPGPKRRWLTFVRNYAKVSGLRLLRGNHRHLPHPLRLRRHGDPMAE